MLTSTLFSLVLVAVTATAALTTAHWLVGRFWRFPHWALRTASLTCLGLLAWSHLIFGLACAHLAGRSAFVGLLVLLAVLAVIGLARLVKKAGKAALQASFSPLSGLLVFAGVLYFGWLVAAASLPPTATDELIYHLEAPRRFLEAGGQPFFQDNIYAFYPQFGEMLFLIALAFHLETAARLFHVLFILLLALALFGYSREFLSRSYALTATMLFLSVPSVMVVGAWAYVDVMFACFAFLALVSLLKFLETEGKSWLWLAAVMAGGACSIKYNGLQYLLLLLLLLLLAQLRGKLRKAWFTAGALLLLVAVLIASPYYLRNFLLTGWPLFPFKLPLFQLSPDVNWDANRAALLLKFLTQSGVVGADSLTTRFLGPILVFVKARFSDFSAYDGFAGPAFLLVPLLWVRVKGAPAQLRLLLLFSAFFLGYWTLTTQQVRFLLPVLPVLAFLLVYGLKELRSRSLQLVIWLFVAANLAVGVNEVFKLRPMAYWTGRESRSDYLARRVRGYEVYQEVSRIVGQAGKVYMVCSFNLLYYFNSPARSDYLFEDYRFAQALSASARPEDVLVFLESQGATHLLLFERSLTHPQAGLPLNDLKKLEQFLASLATEIYRQGDFRLFRLAVLRSSEQQSGFSNSPNTFRSPKGGPVRCSFSIPRASRR